MRKVTSAQQPRPLQASKWLKSQVLMDSEETSGLFDALGEFKLYLAGSVTPEGQGELPRYELLEVCHHYISALREGREPDANQLRAPFSAIITVSDDVLYAVEVGEGKQLIRAEKPVVQLQYHTMDYSMVDGKFRPMVLGKESISWGIQFSYPQLFQDTHDILTVDETFPNTYLFRALQRWIRHNTIPTPFVVQGIHTNVPMRLGKRCLSWINNHPHLIAKGITVDAS